jgi:hypothetical protein
MPKEFPESDWKHLRSIRRGVLDRFCERIMRESAAIMDEAAFSPHERYLRLYRTIRDRDRDVAIAFNDMRRSTAIRHIASMMALDLLTLDEFEGFSRETRDAALDLKEIIQSRKNKPLTG